MELFREIEQRERDVRRNRANQATNTGAFAKFLTTGTGPFEFEEMVDFVVAYIEEPFMSYGARIDSSDLRDLMSTINGEDFPEDEAPPFPLTTGFVTEWQMDTHGFYVGAWVGVRVHTPEAYDFNTLKMSHYYRFEGIALKGV